MKGPIIRDNKNIISFFLTCKSLFFFKQFHPSLNKEKETTIIKFVLFFFVNRGKRKKNVSLKNKKKGIIRRVFFVDTFFLKQSFFLISFFC